MNRLNIRTQQPQIGIATQPGVLEMHKPQPSLKIEQSSVDLEIHTTPAELQIDQYPSRASYGMLSVADRIKKTANQAKQAARDGTARRAREGAAFTETANPQGVIASQAKAKLCEMPAMQVQLCRVTRPTIDYTPGKVDINVAIKPATVSIDNQPVEINYTRPEVDTYLKQKADVQMWVTEDKYDIYA